MGYLFTITNSGGSLPEKPSGSLGCPLSAYGSVIILLVLLKKTGTQRKIQRIQNKQNKAVCRMQCVTIQTCSLSHTITFLAVYFPYFRVGREMPLPQISLFPVGAGLHPWFLWFRPVSTQNGILVGLLVLHGSSLCQRDRQTDKHTHTHTTA